MRPFVQPGNRPFGEGPPSITEPISYERLQRVGVRCRLACPSGPNSQKCEIAGRPPGMNPSETLLNLGVLSGAGSK